MSWGGRASIDRMNYATCEKALSTARNKGAGKPLGTIRIFDRGTHYAVQQYRTDIVRYYPDGSFSVCTGWTSASTISAIENLIGKHIRNTPLPTFDGRLSDTLRHYEIDGVVFKGKDGYIRFNPDKTIDLNTVGEIDIRVISDKGRVSSLRKRIKFLTTQITLRHKLGVVQTLYTNPHHWLAENLEVANDEVDYGRAPEVAGLLNIRAVDLAQMVGATKTIQFKEFA